MDVRQQSMLVSNHTNWELLYQDSERPKESHLQLVAALIITTITWPFFVIIGTGGVIFNSYSYFKAAWNQHRLIKVLSNQKDLEEYAEKRIQNCEKQIEFLKTNAIELMEIHLDKPDEVGLPIPQKKTFLDYLRSNLPDSYWTDFPWNDFLSTDFFQKSIASNPHDKRILKELEEVRTGINYLSHQKTVLLNPEGRVEATRKIAEMSFIKNAFKKQESKQWIVHTLFWLLPSGAFWDRCFNSPRNDRLTYEGKKVFLASVSNFQPYNDLVDAHNQLVKNHNFLVPYMTHKMI